MKKRYRLVKIAGLVLLSGMAVCFWAAKNEAKADPLQPQIAEKILRFHVLGNSDSKEDQEVKLKVRDAIGAYMSDYLKDAGGIEQTREIVEVHMDEIIEVAEQVLEEEGFDYGADAMLTDTEFPEKTYGDYTFPAGTYEALEVVLGDGAGHNWWCVLYPNMCFRGSVYEVVEEEAGKALREVLTPEEYADVFDSGKYRVRLKFLEYFR